MNFKVRTPRDNKFCKWLLTLPCAKCDKSSYHMGVHMVAHHTETGGMGIKGSDYSCVPLCTECHSELHNTKSKAGFWTEEELAALLERLNRVYELMP